jgi:hypothetical protein
MSGGVRDQVVETTKPTKPLTDGELFDFFAALSAVHARLSAAEVDALREVRIFPDTLSAVYQGHFWGRQLRRDPDLEDTIAAGSRCFGDVRIFVRNHRGDLAALAVTIHHELDHALGFDEAEVLRRARPRGYTSAEVELFRMEARPFWNHPAGYWLRPKEYKREGVGVPLKLPLPPPRKRSILG